MWYRVAKASEYLVITGAGIDDIKLAKKAWILPGQSHTVFDLSPVNYTFEVQAMSSEKLPFVLPAVFTIGPREDDMPSLHKYAKLLCSHDMASNHVQELVQGIIEGETRVLAASMTMEDVFKGTKEFKQEVFDKVQLELNQFGLLIYNANVKQLVDVPGHEYFSYLGQKIQMEAANKARVDVAEAKKKGEIGSKEREGMTLQNAAKINAETKIYATKREGEGKKEEIKVKSEVKVYENMREAEVAEANAELAKKKAVWTKEAKVAEVEAAKAVALRDAELQQEVEKMHALSKTEKLKADLLSEATVEYETKKLEADGALFQKQKAAEAELFTKKLEAEARLYAKKLEAEAQKAVAETQLYAKKQEAEAQKAIAEAQLYAKKLEAEGLMALGQAEGAYLRSLLEAVGGNYNATRDFMMLKNGTFQEIAKINAEAVRGLKPNISVWNNGGGDSGANGAFKEVAGVYKMLPPLLKTVHEQTGMLPPSWMGTLSNSPSTNSTLDST
ncbi:PREDICTED: flotillin-like protein 3 isoform X2 [Prunus mume]|uniref:Flotillin-like n=1 Tax=Prunus mume TaxID=102107 RepID=A0ABM1LJ21_PRUMU|nr:PREDICTED: flotillin-like protein 3 isoform X2 [Prunus mume]